MRKLTGGRPALKSPAIKLAKRVACLLAHCRLGCRDFRLHGIEVEARAFLHRWELDRSHRELLNLLLDEDEAPELVFEPVEVLLRSIFSPAIRPACALEWIEAQVGQVGHVGLGFITQPAPRLVDETILVVVNAHGTKFAFPEVPDFVPIRRPLAGYHVHLVVAVQMHLVGSVTELLALLQLFADVRITRRRKESREPVEPRDDAVLDLARRYLARPADNRRYAEAAFQDRALALRERCLSAVRPSKDFGAVVGGEDDNGIVVDTHVLELLHHQTDVVVKLRHTGFMDGPAVLRVAHRLVLG